MGRRKRVREQLSPVGALPLNQEPEGTSDGPVEL